MRYALMRAFPSVCASMLRCILKVQLSPGRGSVCDVEAEVGVLQQVHRSNWHPSIVYPVLCGDVGLEGLAHLLPTDLPLLPAAGTSGGAGTRVCSLMPQYSCTLDAYVEARGGLPDAEWCLLLLQMLHVLVVLQEHGVVHGDVKVGFRIRLLLLVWEMEGRWALCVWVGWGCRVKPRCLCVTHAKRWLPTRTSGGEVRGAFTAHFVEFWSVPFPYQS